MKVTFLGAAGGEVTGSAYLLETRSANVLVDCGYFQGSRTTDNYNRIPKEGAISNLHAVVLTHAHLDHTGRLPLLTKAEYDGPIHATPATFDLAELIMAGSGMCSGGRIMHHLKYNLPIPETTVLIVGFQSHGSLGRALVDGKKVVTIQGQKIPVRASTQTMGGLSGHAGQKDLVNWFDSMTHSGLRVILTHGEDKVRDVLRRIIADRHQIAAECPGLGESLEI